MINSTIDKYSLNLPKFKAGYTIDHGVLVVWREGDILDAIIKKEPLVIQRQFITILKGIVKEPKDATGRILAESMVLNLPIRPVEIKAGCLRYGSTRTHKRYWLAILRKLSTWNQL